MSSYTFTLALLRYRLQADLFTVRLKPVPFGNSMSRTNGGALRRRYASSSTGRGRSLDRPVASRERKFPSHYRRHALKGVPYRSNFRKSIAPGRPRDFTFFARCPAAAGAPSFVRREANLNMENPDI